jgi:hypothetical protein
VIGGEIDNDDFCDEIEDANPIPRWTIAEAKTASWCRGLAVLTLTFAAGVLIGAMLPSERMLGQASQATSTADSGSEDYAVSYNFLSTTRGKEVIDELDQIMNSEGPKQVLERISKLMDDDAQIAASCHPLAHRIGREAFARFGFPGAFGTLPGTEDDAILRTCNAAFMHGVIEHYLAAHGNLPDAVASVKSKLCDKLTPPKSGASASNGWECHHGMGHGIVQHVRAQKEKETLSDALTYCMNTTTDTEVCQNGVWMDHFASTRVTDLVEPESLKVCKEFASETLLDFDCYVYAPTAYLLHNPRDYVGAIQFCIAGLENPGTCIMGAGTQAAKENMMDYSPVETACLSAPTTNLAESCFSSALDYHAMSTGSRTIPAFICDNLTHFRNMCLGKT